MNCAVSYFKTILRDDYKEPKNAEEVKELTSHIEQTPGCPTQRPFYMKSFQVSDVYIGKLDGFAYGSHDRYVTMRQKGILKPVGPTDMFKYSATEQCNYGWFFCDPALMGASWAKISKRCHKPISPNTRRLDNEKRCNKYARLY